MLKRHLKTIVVGSLLIGTFSNASVLEGQKDFELKNQEVLHSQTNFRNIEQLKKEQSRIHEIIHKFNVLEEALTGFEDKLIVNKIKNEFKNKYLVTNSDLILINKKINQAIKVKEENEVEK